MTWNVRTLLAMMSAAPLLLLGCKSTPPPAKTEAAATATTAAPNPPLTPPRPTTAPPPFRVFHAGEGSFTLVTKDSATDDEIAAILWQLRDAARTHTLAKLKVNQADADKYSPAWFHVYRGPKCASEKYGSGKLPCGGGYHAAGDYTYGGPKNPNWDTGALLHGEDARETQLWNPDAPYSVPTQQADASR